jgi:hypothetical protein
LRAASLWCLGVWAAIWVLFLAIRFSSFDIRIIPGIGPVMLLALVTSLAAPLVATVIAGLALLRQPRVALNWLILACAVAALVGQDILFAVNQWL